jgi:hypothetical protein
VKKILLQLDTDRCPSAFDSIAAYDAGADVVQPYASIRPEDVREIVYGAIFTRGKDDLKHTAIWIGGTDLPLAEEMVKAALGTFFGYFRVSVMLDAMGANTTSAALVAKVVGATEVRGRRAVLFGGAGRVGSRAATLLASEGAHVVVADVPAVAQRAQALCEDLRTRYGVEATFEAVATDADRERILPGATVLVSTGPPGLQTVPRRLWAAVETLRVLADTNAVPPLGIEGVELGDDGAHRDGKLAFGAIGIGNFKMKVHYACVARLFQRNDLVIDHLRAYEIARDVAAAGAPA